MTKVKVCCIANLSEAELAYKYGAFAIGLVGHMPSGPGIISDEQILKISSSFSNKLHTFLLTSRIKANEIAAHHKIVETTTIQIVDEIAKQELQTLRYLLPQVKIVQVVHVNDESSIDRAIEASTFVDFILLDSGNPNAAVKTLGGTGNTHNWKLSRKIVETLEVPVFLAGGINPQNVRKAIDEVNPFGIDLCSGLRSQGALDENKLATFFSEINNM